MTEKHLEEDTVEVGCEVPFSDTWVLEIPMKLKSLNEYTKACRGNRYAGAEMKKDMEGDLAFYICRLPIFEKPVKIHFHWIEDNNRRDPDNICFAKKFILDTMVREGRLTNDNRKWVKGFVDTFETAKEPKVILYIEEVEDGEL